MERKEGKRIEVHVDTYTRVCLTVLAVLLTVVMLGLWADGVPGAGNARAGEIFVDSGAQRKAMVVQQEKTNARLQELITLFKSGQAKVKVVDAKPAAVKPAPRK